MAGLKAQCPCSCCLVARSCLTALPPHGLQPTKLLCSWNFPGKNTGVGRHFLLQGSNLHLLLWQGDSLPLSHLGSPPPYLQEPRKSLKNSLETYFSSQAMWGDSSFLQLSEMKVTNVACFSPKENKPCQILRKRRTSEQRCSMYFNQETSQLAVLPSPGIILIYSIFTICHYESESEVAQLCPTLRPHGLQPTRLLHPWNFLGKSTGVGCHFLLQGIFPIRGSNPGLPHCRQTLLPFEPPGNPICHCRGGKVILPLPFQA